jgi:hypothetical protein
MTVIGKAEPYRTDCGKAARRDVRGLWFSQVPEEVVTSIYDLLLAIHFKK